PALPSFPTRRSSDLVLAGGEPREGKLLPAVLAILGVAVWKAAAIVLRRNAAGYLQFKTQQDVREQLIEHQLGLSLSWFGRQSMRSEEHTSELQSREN